MIKQILLFALCLFSTLFTYANDNAVNELMSQGNKVFIEVVNNKKNIDGGYDSFIEHLSAEEWNKWDLVETKDNANFICRLTLTKRKVMGSVRVDAIASILTIDGTEVWVSEKHTGMATLFTGFDALSDAMRKIIRRALSDELCEEIMDKRE